MFQIFQEHKGFGKQILLLAKNELIKKYKGAVIGPLWSVVKPLFTLFVYWFAFEVGLKNAGKGVAVIFPEMAKSVGEFTYSRFLFMLIGFIPWFFINESIVQGAKSIRENRQFVNKVSFPVSTIMTYTSVARLYVHIFLLGLMYLFITFIGGDYTVLTDGVKQTVSGGVSPSIYNVQILFYMPLMFIFFLVLSWSTAPMSAFSRDFENMIVSVMSGIFWLSGIIYDSYLLAANPSNLKLLRYFMMLNPINFFANGYRNCFLYHRWFWDYTTELYIFLGELVVITLLGIFNYNRLRKRLPDVL